MKLFKLKKLMFILSLVIIFMVTISVGASTSTHKLITSNGTTVYYSGTDEAVMIPDQYELQAQYLRGAWVTPLAGSIPTYTTEAKYKQEITEMLDVLEYYNCNAVMFHIRIMNDALYPSGLNPASSYMNTSNDLLTYVISECHKRGIEFHAWMNPYRVKSSGATSLGTIATSYKSKAPKNPASSVDNMLINSAGAVILNPGLQNVRDFIVDTCMEVIENYDVDAIHFDDYFYISDVDDESLYQSSNPNNLGKSDWRREQVNLFIEKLSKTMRAYNEANDRYVQLGISPTGIYDNGDGVVTYDENGNAISSGSKTNGQNHYESYLYCDTKNWINHEWIDYICPQSYWGFTHPVAGYADVMSWWNKVVEYKKVNLYSGMGIYMSENPGKNYSWGYDSNESVNQILYASTLKNTDGTAFYNYNFLEKVYKGDRDSLYGKGLTKIKNELWTNPAILPQIKSMTCVTDKISKLTVNNTNTTLTLSFNKVENAKFYVVYRTVGKLTYAPEEVYKIFGSEDDIVKFVDEKDGQEYNYGIKVLSETNTLSEEIEYLSIKFNVVFKDFEGKVISTQKVGYGEQAVAPTLADKPGSEFVGWSKDYSYVTRDLEITPKYKDSDFIVTFYGSDGLPLSTQSVKYQGTAEPPKDAPKEGFVFDGWEGNYTNVTKDEDLYPLYKEKYCNIKIVDWDGRELLTYVLKYGLTGYFPEAPVRDGYIFTGWSDELNPVKDDTVVTAVYEKEMFDVTLINGFDDSIITVLKVAKYDDVVLPEAPVIEGYRFTGWFGNIENIKFNTKVTAQYEEIYYDIYFLDMNGDNLDSYTYFYGEEEYFPTAPEVSGYTFIKWDLDYSKLPDDTSEIYCKPIYVANTIKITYLGFDDVVLDEKTYNYGDQVIPFDNAPEVNGYNFVKWDSELSTEWKSQTIKAIYEKKPQAVIRFLGFENTVILEVTYTGEKISLPTAPEVSGYLFLGWDKELKDANENQDITALYGKYATVKFIGLNDVVISEEKFTLEKFEVTLPNAPTVEGYTFKAWDKEVEEKLEDQEIKAVYEQNKYKVTYVYNGITIYEEEVLHGNDAMFSFDIPEVDGFKFEKFSNEGKNITSDQVIELVYTEEGGCNFMSVIRLCFMMSFIMVFAFMTKKH